MGILFFSALAWAGAWAITLDATLASRITLGLLAFVGGPVVLWRLWRTTRMPFRFGVYWDGATPCCARCRAPLQPRPSRFAGARNGMRAASGSIHRLTCPRCGLEHTLTRNDGGPITLDEARRIIVG